MAAIRAADWGTEEYWKVRILEYLNHERHPGQALRPRVAFVCLEDNYVVGFIAGHLTRRLGCAGELQWISIRPQFRGRGIASELLRRLAEWFEKNDALRVCVDVNPANEAARRFYARHSAEDLKPHRMIWHGIRKAFEVQPLSR